MHREDFICLSKQLGRPPVGVLEVVARNRSHTPLVIKVSPLINQIPFPTLYWLTCPQLKKQISHWERKGLIKEWEQDREMMNKLREDHLHYQKQRMSLLQEIYPNWKKLPETKIRVLKDTGIGGIQDFSHLKCLHLHYAHYLAQRNRVGQRLHSLLKTT